MDQVWLTDEQFAKIALHLPTDTRGKERVDDQRVIGGIIHVLKSGGRWSDASREVYGPKKTSTIASYAGRPRTSWLRLFKTLAQAPGRGDAGRLDAS